MKIEEIADTLGQYFELAVVIASKLIPFGLTVQQVKGLIEDKDHPFWIAFNEATKLLAPKPIPADVVAKIEPAPASPVSFKVEDTNLVEAIKLAERFAKERLGIVIKLAEKFVMPTELPWKDVLVVFDSGLDNREAVKKAIKSQGLDEWEEENVMKYSESAALPQATLRIIENSLTPSADTLGKKAKSPDQLNADGRFYLDLRGYALAFGLRFFGFKDYLDPSTWTWFPKNRLPGGGVACGCWSPVSLEVKFIWCNSGSVNPGFGARLAIQVPSRT